MEEKWMQRGKGLSRSLFLEITSFIRGSDAPLPAKSIIDKENQLPLILPENSNIRLSLVHSKFAKLAINPKN
jgi:hypothetical protein